MYSSLLLQRIFAGRMNIQEKQVVANGRAASLSSKSGSRARQRRKDQQEGVGQRAPARSLRPHASFRRLRDVSSRPKRVGRHGVAERRGGMRKRSKQTNDTNTTTSAPHRSHAVAGWSQAAGTPHDPTTPYLLATPQALRNSAEGSGGAAGDEPR